MALSVINNIASFRAQQALQTSNTHLSRALSHLSTGLRINNAADDPSGLAISERFRVQINGLARATLNAMDAQSMLQTAEGSLGETHSVLQRMRELAVQAANGVLTASDRQEIQREVDQLKEEIDRIAYTTEFNTKKLLDGSSAALWSANSSDITAIIRGQVAEGNYQLVKDNVPTKNHVLKSDVFRVKDGAISQREDGSPNQFRFSLGGADGDLAGLSGGAATFSTAFSFDGGTTWVQIDMNSLSEPGFNDAEVLVRAINTHATISQNVEAELLSDNQIVIRAKDASDESDTFRIRFTGTASMSAAATLSSEITNWAGVSLSASADVITATGVAFSDLDLVTTNAGTAETFGTDNQTAEDNEVVAGVGNALNLQAGDYDIITVADADIDVGGTGLEADQGFLMAAYRTSESTGEITLIDNVALTESSYVIVEVVGEGAAGAMDVRVSWDQGANWTQYDNVTTGTLFQENIGDATNQFSLTTTGDFKVGDKFLIGLQDEITSGTANIARLTGPASVWTNVQNADGDWNPRENYAGADYQTFDHGLWVDASSDFAGNADTLTFAHMDAEGQITFGSLDVTWGTEFNSQSTNLTIIGSGGVAGPDTILSKVDRFYDNNGNFVLGDSGKWISVYTAAGEGAEFYVDGSDTLQELADKIEQIISKSVTDQGWSGLNLGEVLDTQGVNHVTDFVVNATANSDEAVPGTMVIRSPKQGTGGYLYFSGEEEVLNALSLATIQDPAEDTDPLTVTVYNAHTGEFVGQDTVSDSILHGVIQGVDVIIDPNVDIGSSWNDITREIDFYSLPGSVQDEYLHLVDASIDFQIGANPGQTMEAYIGQMDSVALGVSGVLMVSQETASQAMDTLDEAINRVSSERARMGSYINRLDHTIANLAVQQENQVAAESTIRDLDMAQAISELTQYQIMQQVGSAMLAQANATPQIILTLLQ